MVTTNTEFDSYLDFAHILADEAAIRLLRWFGSATASTKSDGSFVTEADLEVDHFIRNAVSTHYPSHSLLTEESSQVFDGAEFTWVVDPLDGTNNFANGLPLWGVSIALLHHGEPLLGVMEFPSIRQRWSAVRGQGAIWNGQPLRVQPPAELHGNQFCLIDSRSFRLVDFTMRLKARLLGSAVYDLAAVSNGVAVACCELLPKIWDIAAVWLVLAEAGVAVAPLFAGPPVFPLQPGTQYVDRVFPLLAAASPAIWQTLRAGIQLRPGSQRLAQRLQSQGWVVES